MFLRSNTRIKDGKQHRYYTVVESRRLQSGKVAQRQVLYLGEINDSRQAAWRKTLEVFDEAEQRLTPLNLFPEDRPVPADAINSVQVKLSEMKLERARPYGNCWLGCELWRQLQLDRFWSEKLPQGREGVAWPQVLELLVVNRLIEPGSEFRLHRHWFDHSAMDVLLGQDFAVAEKDRLYRCLDRVLEPLLKTKDFPASDLSNCEGWVNTTGRKIGVLESGCGCWKSRQRQAGVEMAGDEKYLPVL